MTLKPSRRARLTDKASRPSRAGQGWPSPASPPRWQLELLKAEFERPPARVLTSSIQPPPLANGLVARLPMWPHWDEG